ncbi:hypothetical protein [Nonomuraea sp. NPDC049141]|uniref:hypothetical protein n=1 Tax=Nonomuraea sp. NPDC049141 TaxID=3155500 RepID=UPI0033E298B1
MAVVRSSTISRCRSLWTVKTLISVATGAPRVMVVAGDVRQLTTLLTTCAENLA